MNARRSLVVVVAFSGGGGSLDDAIGVRRAQLQRVVGEAKFRANPHFIEVEALRRRGDSGARAVAGREHLVDDGLGEAPAADVDERSGDDADHVLEKRGAFDFEREERGVAGVFADDGDAKQVPNGAGALAIGRAKTAKIVGSDELFRGALDRVEVELVVHVPGSISKQRVARWIVADEVAVALSCARAAGVEARGDLARFHHRNLGRKLAVHPQAPTLHRNGGVGLERGHLRERVHACVGASCAVDADGLARDLAGGALELFLHRASVALTLPAREVGAVVAHDESNRRHGGTEAYTGGRACGSAQLDGALRTQCLTGERSPLTNHSLGGCEDAVTVFDEEVQQEIARAARLVEETITALGIDAASVRMPAPGGGKAWSLMRGSAAVAIFLRSPRPGEDAPFLRVVSPIIVIDKSNEASLFRRLLELNASGLGSVAFGVHDDRVVAVSERPTRDLDPSEVRYILQVVGAVADHYDDELTRLFGGTKVSDRR